jgi:class 3 adenylate cyclase/tetratricopeptide (TPR) repeat protein
VPEEAKFCLECGTKLAPVPSAAEERKVVTSLFCDLVGFTASSESADPEDVDVMLRAYHQMARSHIEGHGGTVEKFVGDAVLGVFGAPVAHEDDPERAVRAALRIVEDAEDMTAVSGEPLRLRAGINTGEALVKVGVDPAASGQGFVTGDTVNTASRLQSIAPEMGVVVGQATYEATSLVFDYEELEPATVKGKSEPVGIFLAKAPLARFGSDLIRTHDSPFIGREIDLALLKGIFEKTVASSSVQLVTVVGEPGIGKSRIVAELRADLDARPGLTTWRQGRCLPYGEGITFWALGEILKAHAGILESDASEVASGKLDHVLTDGPERQWFRQRLLPLLGMEASSVAEREELFTAWRRFLEQIAEERPTVLVFEDLHWADAAMLDFVEHLVDRAEGVPLLIVATTRPELFEGHPEYAGGLPNANRINLSTLSNEETARLVSALLDAAVIPAELQVPILERSGGNPLYAEEFVRLLRDKDLLVEKGSSWELAPQAEVPFPDSVQALIAARLDTLSPERKALLADAAVLGKVFWAGAVARMGERQLDEVRGALRELSRKELVRSARRSSIEGEDEYAFWHILARDVAYAQLPRASRASRHVAAAGWIESKASERVEDLAEVLAYHYSTALDLARAAGQGEFAAELKAPTLRFLLLAGERALGLNTAAALGSFQRALELTPDEHPERADVLVRYGDAVFQAGHVTKAADALYEAIGLFRERGDLAAAAATMAKASGVLHALGDRRWSQLPEQGLALLERVPPGPELVKVLTEAARGRTLAGFASEGVAAADRALELARELGLEQPARTLGYRGLARTALGEEAGLREMREAIELAVASGQGRDAASMQNNLATTLALYEGPMAALEVFRAGITFAHARGLSEAEALTTASTQDVLIDLGEFDDALRIATELASRSDTGGDVLGLISARSIQARVLAIRGQAARVAPFLDWLEATARGEGSTHSTVLGLSSSASARAQIGDVGRAAALLAEVADTPGAHDREYYAVYLPTSVRTALAIGDRELAQHLVEGFRPRYPYAEHALVAAKAALSEARGEIQAAVDAYADAAGRWRRFTNVPERAFALLGHGRCLIALARPTEAKDSLRGARENFAALGADPSSKEIDGLLADVIASSESA